MTFELPSGLPEGPWKLETHPDGRFSIWAPPAPGHYMWLLCSRNPIDHRATESLTVARAIASIPDMVEEIGRLRAQIGDIQTLLDAAIAGLADNERLRALNAEMREALESLMPAAIKDPVWLKAHAILTKSQEAP